MVLIPFALAAGLILGLLRRGRLENILALRPSAWPVLIGGIVMLLIGEYADIPRSSALGVFVLGSLTLIYSLLKNTRFTGAITMAIGLGLNLLAVVANGHVPVRYDALVGSGEVNSQVAEADVALTGLREMENSDTLLPLLGEVVPIEPLDAAVSFGDLILTAGAVVFAMHLLLARRRRGIDVDTLLGSEWVMEESEPLDLRTASQEDAADEKIDLRFDGPTLRPAANDGARVFGPDESDFHPPTVA